MKVEDARRWPEDVSLSPQGHHSSGQEEVDHLLPCTMVFLVGLQARELPAAKTKFSSSQGTREEGHRAASWHRWMDHATFSEGFFTSLCNVKLFTSSSR